MSFIKVIPPHRIQGDAAAMYLREQNYWGYVPNYATVFCHRPEVMARWGQLLAEIRRPMEARRFELVTFVTAHLLKNSACSLAHGRALQTFFSSEEILAIAEGRFDGILSGAEQAMLGFVRQIATDASRVTSAQVQALLAHGFSDAEIFDIAACAAGRAFFAKLLDALGVEMDSPFLTLETELRRTLTVGRPIATGPSGTMPIPAFGLAKVSARSSVPVGGSHHDA